MGFATHLGPWLLGTVKNTTGTTDGSIRNTGCSIVSQQAALGFADGATKHHIIAYSFKKNSESRLQTIPADDS